MGVSIIDRRLMAAVLATIGLFVSQANLGAGTGHAGQLSRGGEEMGKGTSRNGKSLTRPRKRMRNRCCSLAARASVAEIGLRKICIRGRR